MQDTEKEVFGLETIKENINVLADFLCTNTNGPIKSCLVPSCVKFEDVKLLVKKERTCAKQNYRPESILPTLSKIYERNRFKQMSYFCSYLF